MDIIVKLKCVPAVVEADADAVVQMARVAIVSGIAGRCITGVELVTTEGE